MMMYADVGLCVVIDVDMCWYTARYYDVCICIL